MLTFFDRLVEVNFTSAAVRMLLAVLCGGIIGMERTYKRRAAGLSGQINAGPPDSAPISSSAWGRL